MADRFLQVKTFLIVLGFCGAIAAFTVNHQASSVNDKMGSMQKDLDGMVVLFNANNEWYRDIDKDNATMRADLTHIKDDIKEIKELLKHRHE